MSQWVKEVMTLWGIQRRRIEMGAREYETAPKTEGKHDPWRTWHIDGWPDTSVVGKAFDARGGDVSGASKQHYPEVLTGDALTASLVLIRAPEKFQRVAYVHYVVPKQSAGVKDKVSKLGYSNQRAYYDDIERLHIWVEAKWPDVPRETNCA